MKMILRKISKFFLYYYLIINLIANFTNENYLNHNNNNYKINEYTKNNLPNVFNLKNFNKKEISSFFQITPLKRFLRILQSVVCLPGFYISFQNRMLKCLPCGTGCINCLSSRFCIQCDASKSYVLDIKEKMELYCRKCSANCNVCSEDNKKCAICEDGYYSKDELDTQLEIQNSCSKCGEICKTCKTEKECTTCNEDNFYYNAILEEDNNKDTTSVKNCVRCNKKNCEKCLEEDANNDTIGCEKSKSGYFIDTIKLSNKLALKVTKSCQKGCLNCTDEKSCVECDKIQGYRIENNQCIKCSENCSECKNLEICDKCAESFFLKNLNNLTSCMPCTNNCKKCEDLDKCLECVSPFQLDTKNKNCNFCNDNCNICEMGSCKSCKNFYYLDEKNDCKFCGEANCKKCNSQGICELCEENFVMQTDRSCITCLSEFCGKCSNTGQCLECINGSFYKDGSCMPCILKSCDKCLNNSVNSVECIKCATGFFLNSKKCDSCKVKFGDNCSTCDSQKCLTCENYASLIEDKDSEFYGQCLKCEIGFSLQDKKSCVKCDQFYELCENCSSIRCTKCYVKAMMTINDTCECNSALYININSTCVEMYIVIFPVLTLFILLICLCNFFYKKLKKRLDERDGQENGNNVNNNVEIVQVNPVSDKDKKFRKARENVDNLHGIKCVFGDDHPVVYWKFDCMGYMCNPCSLKFVTCYDSDKSVCPKCNKDFKEFIFILSAEKNLNDKVLIEDIKQDMKKSINQSVSDSICKICFVLKHSKLINCQSNTPHHLCYYCFNRMIVIEENKTCPFDRTEIK